MLPKAPETSQPIPEGTRVWPKQQDFGSGYINPQKRRFSISRGKVKANGSTTNSIGSCTNSEYLAVS